MANKVVCLIQARMQSQRLPGKSLEMIGPQTLLGHCYLRALQSQSVSRVVIATGRSEANDPIADLCHGQGWPCYRGDDFDVLDRLYCAALQHQADIIIRISGDSPLIDGEIIDRLVKLQRGKGYRYVTNATDRGNTWPDGLDTEVLTWLTLCHMHKCAVLPSQREHPTSWIWTNLPTHRWAVLHRIIPTDLSRYRLCVDTPDDLAAMRQIMHIAGPDCTWRDAIEVIDQHPEIAALLSARRNEGYAVSVAKERGFAQSSTGG